MNPRASVTRMWELRRAAAATHRQAGQKEHPAPRAYKRGKPRNYSHCTMCPSIYTVNFKSEQ